MPITVQKRRYPKQPTKAISDDQEEYNGSGESCMSKVMNRIPAALILLFLIFLWSSSTTFISGSIFHVCVTSRRLSSHLYCVSAGTQPSNKLDTPQPIASSEPPLGLPISGLIRTPLSSLSNSAKESVSLTEHDKPPSTVSIQKNTADDVATRRPVSPIIQLPVASNSNAKHSPGGTREEGLNKTDLPPAVQSPSVYGGAKNMSLTKEIIPGPESETKSTTKPPSITVKEEIKDKTAKKPNPPSAESTLAPPAPAIVMKKLENRTKLEVESPPAPVTVSKQPENKTKLEEEIELGKIEAEEQMEVLRSYKIGKAVNYSTPGACGGKRIYVYDLPSKFNKDLLNLCHEMIIWLGFCKFLSNNAFGEPVQQLGDGWHNTHQYALEPIFHARILNHPCRVHNAEEAKVFYVPYYGGLDILRWHFKKNITLPMKDRLSYELVEWLSQQAPWKNKLGLDHLFVLGKISWDFRRMTNFTWGTHFLDMDEMQSPMKLLIERHPWHINDIGIPHPSFFHPRSDNDILAWQEKLMQTPRKNLVSFAGAPRPRAKASIRSTLIEQCTSAPAKCRFFDCREGRCTQPGPMVDLFTGSEFCLQPVGDSATRKSVFDSLVSGCIPVLFSPFTAYLQYPWHLPANRSDYSVFVEQEDVRRQRVNVVDRLVAIPAARREEMRRHIVYELLPGLLYADPKGKLERFEDAFTVAMNGVLERMSRLP